MKSTNTSSETGSVHIVIVIVLVVVVLGVVGYVYWTKFATQPAKTEDAVSKQTTASKQESSKPTSTESYEMESYSFGYPAEGWRVSEQRYNGDEGEPTAVVRTSNYAQTRMGLDAGAEVAINVTHTNETLAVMKKAVTDFAGGAQYKDLKDTKVAGVDAFTYNSAYEGTRYHTVFVYKGWAYDIIYQYGAGEKAETYMHGYETIVSNFKLK
jgi:cytoskeletal protein RodZ